MAGKNMMKYSQYILNCVMQMCWYLIQTCKLSNGGSLPSTQRKGMSMFIVNVNKNSNVMWISPWELSWFSTNWYTFYMNLQNKSIIPYLGLGWRISQCWFSIPNVFGLVLWNELSVLVRGEPGLGLLNAGFGLCSGWVIRKESGWVLYIIWQEHNHCIISFKHCLFSQTFHVLVQVSFKNVNVCKMKEILIFSLNNLIIIILTVSLVMKNTNKYLFK